MTNAADRKSLNEQRKKARQAEIVRGQVIATLMSHPDGRGYIWDILTEAHVFVSSFTGNALTTAFAEGERNFGLRLLNDITQWCPELFIEMLREHKDGRPDPDAPGADDAAGDGAYDPFGVDP